MSDLKSVIEESLEYLTGKYGDKEGDGTKVLRIYKSDAGDGGISFKTIAEWIENEIERIWE